MIWFYVVITTCTEGMFNGQPMRRWRGLRQGRDSRSVTFAVTAGTDYFVVVDGFSGQFGPFNLSVTGLLSPLDIDGDGEVRRSPTDCSCYAGSSGSSAPLLVTGAVDLVNCTRCSSVAIESYLARPESHPLA